MYRIGIDLGGTNTAAGLVDAQGRIVDRASVKTNLPTDPQRIVQDMVYLTNLLLERNGLQKEQVAMVGVGVPCTANAQTGWMQDADHLGFPGAPLVEPLEKALGLPVAMGNDADAAALGEYRGGGYEGNSFVLVTLGTGIGGGIILGGKLYRSCNNAAGELGHMAICLDGDPCVCGGRGCFETYGSATALIRQAREATGEDITEAKTVFDRAQAGDEICREVLDRYFTYLAIGFANIINIFGPDHLCIGGGVSAAGDALLKPVIEKTYERVYAKDAKHNTKIVLAQLHNDAGILGAAMLEK
jgi:glucokinase